MSEDGASVRVLLWDVRVGGDRRLPLIERIDADIVLLLGVSRKSGRTWTRRWEGHYHCEVGLEIMPSVSQKRPHGALIASRWPAWEDPPLPGQQDDRDGLIRNQLAFTGRNPAHDLIDAHRFLVDRDEHRRRLLADLRPYGPLATTFIRRPGGEPLGIAADVHAGVQFGLDRMDRIYVTREIEPLACEHLYHESRDAGGDHAAVIADIRLRAPQRRPPDLHTARSSSQRSYRWRVLPYRATWRCATA